MMMNLLLLNVFEAFCVDIRAFVFDLGLSVDVKGCVGGCALPPLPLSIGGGIDIFPGGTFSKNNSKYLASL